MTALSLNPTTLLPPPFSGEFRHWESFEGRLRKAILALKQKSALADGLSSTAGSGLHVTATTQAAVLEPLRTSKRVKGS